MKIIESFTEDQIKEIHNLYKNEWWTKKRSFEDTKLCISGSQICIGVVDDNQILYGFARVLTDYIFKALIFDIIVSPDHRDKGIGKQLLLHIKNHPKLNKVKHFELYCLPEMFPFYENFGFSSDVGEIKLMRYTNV